jgi:hypothetical protein
MPHKENHLYNHTEKQKKAMHQSSTRKLRSQNSSTRKSNCRTQQQKPSGPKQQLSEGNITLQKEDQPNSSKPAKGIFHNQQQPSQKR